MPESVPEPEPVKEEDPWGFTATTVKRSKKKKAQDELKDKEPQLPEPEPEAMRESTPPPPEAEPEPVEELAVDLFVGLSKMQKDDPWAGWGAATTTGKKKKKKKKGAKEELRVEEPPPPLELEPFIEPKPSPPAKQKAKDDWGDWGATVAPVKKSKQKKGVAAMISEPPKEEHIPEPELVIIPGPIAELEPVEEKDDGGDWGFSSIWGGGKKKNDTKKGALVEQEEKRAEEEEKPMQGSMPEISSVLCPRRFHHLSEGDGWKLCERCRAMIREFAAQLEE